MKRTVNKPMLAAALFLGVAIAAVVIAGGLVHRSYRRAQAQREFEYFYFECEQIMAQHDWDDVS